MHRPDVHKLWSAHSCICAFGRVCGAGKRGAVKAEADYTSYFLLPTSYFLLPYPGKRGAVKAEADATAKLPAALATAASLLAQWLSSEEGVEAMDRRREACEQEV